MLHAALELGGVKAGVVPARWSGPHFPTRLPRRGVPLLDPGRLATRFLAQRRRRRRPARTTGATPRHFPCPPFAEYTRCPFNPDDYKRVKLQVVKNFSPYPPQGTLLLVEDRYDVTEGDVDTRVLAVHVGGDILTSIAHAAAGREPERPMTVNLIDNILEYHRQLQPMEWHLLHAAIVDLRESVFIGRLFFGNPETGEIRWDCDCRPSDGCWLAQKRGCPLYVRNYVWESCAEPIEKIISNPADVRASLESLGRSSETSPIGDPADPLTTIRPSDPTVIKRLKREMAVAVTEEDYATAARIRDHPYMRKYKSIFDLRKEGKHAQASDIEQELRQQIEREDAVKEDGEGDVDV